MLFVKFEVTSLKCLKLMVQQKVVIPLKNGVQRFYKWLAGMTENGLL